MDECDEHHPQKTDVTCFLDKGHKGTHEGAVYDEDGEYDGSITWQ